MLLIRILEPVVFIFVWVSFGKFVQNVLQIETYEWIIFWGFITGSLAVITSIGFRLIASAYFKKHQKEENNV